MKVKVIFNNENERYKIYNGDTVINANELTINEIPIDSELSPFSANAVENRVIKEALDDNIKEINNIKADVNNDISAFGARIDSIITKGSSTIAGNDFSWDWDDATTGRIGYSNNFKLAPNTVVFLAIPEKCNCRVLLNDSTIYNFGDDIDSTETQLGVFVTDSNITDTDNFTLLMQVTSGSDYMDIRALVEANTTLVKVDYPEELKDIRVDYNGKVWSSAGDAVRGQINKINSTFNDIYNSYDYNELEKEEITEDDYGYYTPAHPTVGQTLNFTSSTSGAYTNLKYDLSNLVGDTIIVQGVWINWTFACAIVDENNKVLAVPPTYEANEYFTWNIQVPAKAKWLYLNGYMFGLGNFTADSSYAKYNVIKPIYKKNKADFNKGNTEKYESALPLSTVENYAISRFENGGQFNVTKVYNNNAMQFEIYSCKAGDKWHISSQNNYSYDAYTVLDLSLVAQKTSYVSGSSEKIDEIIEIQNDGYIIFQHIKTLTSAFIRRAYKYTSDKRSISGLKVSICGDSVMAGANGSPVGKLLSNDYDIIPQSIAVAGAQMTTANPNVSHICEQVEQIDEDTDIIILEGGVNDFWNSNVTFGTFVGNGDTTTVLDTTTFCGALETALRWIRDNRPHIPVLYVLNHHIASADYGTNADGKTFQDYRDLILRASQNYGVLPVRVDLTAFNTTVTQTDYAEYSDGGAHPTDKGYRKWYLPLIVEAIQKSIG